MIDLLEVGLWLTLMAVVTAIRSELIREVKE